MNRKNISDALSLALGGKVTEVCAIPQMYGRNLRTRAHHHHYSVHTPFLKEQQQQHPELLRINHEEKEALKLIGLISHPNGMNERHLTEFL